MTVAGALCAGAGPASGQCSMTLLACEPPPSLWDRATIFGVNALLGGLSAGVLQAANGGSFLDGRWRGTLGGGLVNGGKRLAAHRVSGAGRLGR